MSGPHFGSRAGPNGARNSSSAAGLLKTLGIDEYVNADVIAQGSSMLHAEEMAYTAGRLAIQRLHKLLERDQSFAFETTLASRSISRLITQAKQQNYEITLIFLALNSEELARERVASRVAAGGHDVPAETIARRFRRGLYNFFHVYRQLADNWYFYDNSDTQKPLAFQKDQITVLDDLFHFYEKLSNAER
jgi:predicted ABC-type ATPase